MTVASITSNTRRCPVQDPVSPSEWRLLGQCTKKITLLAWPLSTGGRMFTHRMTVIVFNRFVFNDSATTSLTSTRDVLRYHRRIAGSPYSPSVPPRAPGAGRIPPGGFPWTGTHEKAHFRMFSFDLHSPVRRRSPPRWPSQQWHLLEAAVSADMSVHCRTALNRSRQREC